MAGGGGGVPRPRAGERRRRRQAAWSLPLDVIAGIAARSDPTTLVRCAATCSELRGRVADPGFRRRLRLRHAADRFVPSLLRGHLVGEPGDLGRIPGLDKDPSIVYLVDATARLLPVADSFPPGPGGEPLTLYRPVSSREGHVLVMANNGLRVCNLATGRSQALPPGPEFRGYYALLVGDGEGAGGGRPFQVVKAGLVLEYRRRCLQVQTFSSELGAWGPCTEIRTPQIQGWTRQTLSSKLLVVDGAVYWLCLTDSAGYVLKIRVRAAAAAAPRLTVTKLPERYPYYAGGRVYHLMVATMAPGGGRSPAVLVADEMEKKILAWTQSKHTARWSQQPQVVIEYEAISQFLDRVGEERLRMWPAPPEGINLMWFAERSGIVLIRTYERFFWLDLQSKEIVRWSSDSELRYKSVYYPCEMDLSTWAPTFSSSVL